MTRSLTVVLCAALAGGCTVRPSQSEPPGGGGSGGGGQASAKTLAPPTPPPNDPNVAAAANDPPLTGAFSDDFNRATLGPDWRSTAPDGTYRIVNGALEVTGAHNHTLWLKHKLPRDVVVEMNVWSQVQEGDIKFELFGDGHTYATEDEYIASSYVLIFGGWHNSISVIARMAEHGLDRKESTDLTVTVGRKYHYRVERHDGHITWLIDGAPFMTYDDDDPLAGAGHDHFGFNNWEADVFYDDLTISPYTADTAPRP